MIVSQSGPISASSTSQEATPSDPLDKIVARIDVVDILENLLGGKMLHQHVIESPSWPGRFLTSVADEDPSRQGLIQSRPLPKPIGSIDNHTNEEPDATAFALSL